MGVTSLCMWFVLGMVEMCILQVFSFKENMCSSTIEAAKALFPIQDGRHLVICSDLTKRAWAEVFQSSRHNC